jgi:hypothetical protein
MSRYVYRALQIPLDPKLPHPAQIEAALNEQGQWGWRVASLELTPRLAVNEANVWALLERELPSEG